MMDWIGDIGGMISDAIGDAVQSVVDYILYNFVYILFYYLECCFCKLVWIADQIYEVFTGAKTVTYDGKSSFLINVFFQNSTINKVYWGMALLGIAFAFGFAIIAVIRKIFDLRDKDQRNVGQVLGSLFRTILLILSMNFIMIVVLNATNILMQQIDYVFNNAGYFGKEDSIVFNEDQFAAMARCLNTIGNYSTNPDYKNYYNVNACYNDIRQDLQLLVDQGVFDFYYPASYTPDPKKKSSTVDTSWSIVSGKFTEYMTENKDGKVISDVKYNDDKSWQSVLQKIVNAHNVNRDINMDAYDETVYKAVTEAMEELQRNPNLKPLKEYKRNYTASKDHIPLDRYVFLIGTLESAKNTVYNKNPEMTDVIRGPYYYGTKNIYDINDVNEDFDISITKTNYLMVYFMGVTLFGDLAMVILTCVSRIFNMLMLYLISPLVFAAEPLDDGAKRKQWTTAFLVQCCAVFGTVVAMRTLMVFIPIIMSSDLVLFGNSDATSLTGFGYAILDLAAKILLIYGGFEVVKKANGIITGILADNAGWQSIQAGDMSQTAMGIERNFANFTMKPWNTTKSIASNFVSQIPIVNRAVGGGGGDGGGGKGSSKSSSLPSNKRK